jgi:uncharacterized protein (TIGR02246 family)
MQMSPDADIQASVRTFLDGWNQHDPAKCASVFSEDADSTNWQGVTIHGRPALAESFKRMFAGRFQASQRTADPPKVRYLTPAIACVDVGMRVNGVAGPDGKPRPDRTTLVVWVAQNGPVGWQVVVAHESNRPTPAAAEGPLSPASS